MDHLFGIDLGGTKVEGVVLTPAPEYTVIYRERIPTEQSKGYSHILARIAYLIDYLAMTSGIKPQKVGIGTPGSLDPFSQTLKNSNTVCLNGKPLIKDLEQLTGLSFTIANDANCFALAETQLGIVKDKVPDCSVVFGVIMGTGVGGGLVVNGKVINGLHGIGGEWGHNFLHESGGDCYCGKTGCVETVLSGIGLQNYYKQKTGIDKSLKEIAQTTSVDPAADETMQRLMQMFGLAISNIINVVDPDAIVLGGGVGNIDLLYTRGVEEIKKHVFNPYLHTPILKPALGDSAGVFGAAMLVE